MKIVVLSNEALSMELLTQGLKENVEAVNVTEAEALLNHPKADAYIDLLFQPDKERIDLLQQLQPKPVLVNAVIPELSLLPEGFIRINGWNTFLKRPVMEAACTDDNMKAKAAWIFSSFHKIAEWVPDIPGFISARVIAMIINEAYFTLQDEVSSKEEIDTAMKLGTNYPYGPFEWGGRIGLKNVYELLIKLAETNKRYEPAALLKKEALHQ
jgi:3-hydroxybutyryl-CoA dehydrogenase